MAELDIIKWMAELDIIKWMTELDIIEWMADLDIIKWMAELDVILFNCFACFPMSSETAKVEFSHNKAPWVTMPFKVLHWFPE